MIQLASYTPLTTVETMGAIVIKDKEKTIGTVWIKLEEGQSIPEQIVPAIREAQTYAKLFAAAPALLQVARCAHADLKGLEETSKIKRWNPGHKHYFDTLAELEAAIKLVEEI